MPTEVLTQLHALRESVADSLRKDPRFLTLSALDRSIAEITGVLTASGLLTEPPAPPPAVHFDAPQPAASATPNPPPQSPPPRNLSAAAAPAYAPAAPPAAVVSAPAPVEPPAAVASPTLPAAASSTAAQAASPVEPGASAAPVAAAEKPKKKRSLLKPLVGAAAALAAVGLTAEAVHLSQGKLGRAAPGKDNKTDPQTDAKDDPQAEAGAAPTGEAAGSPDAGVIPEGKASGYTPMAAKPDATQYQPALSVKFGKLPNKVDLRPLMTPIEDQGDTMSCVANAVAGAYEYWIKKATKQDTNVSRLFVYYNARWRDGSQDKDEGSVIQLAMDGLAKFGACNEQVWPFDTRLVIKKPGADAYQDGAAWKVQDMAQVPTTLEAWKQALAEGKPIVFGIALFDTFDKCSQRGGVVEMPSPEDVARASHSGHAMCAVGYSDSEKVFIVRNSWGPDWGDKGYCYMPYAYLLNPKFNDGDNWVFVPKVPMQPPREVWSDDTSPVTNDGRGVDFVIERFRVEDYEHVVFDFFERVRKPFNTFIGQDFSEYVSFARQSLWQSMERFDYRSFLASTVALSGAAIATTAIASEFSSTETSSSVTTSETSLLDEEQDEDETEDTESDEDEAEDEESDEDEAEDEDAAEDEESDEDAAEDEESDEDGAEDEESDEDAAEDEESDEDAAEDEESDEDAAEDEESDEDETEDEGSDDDEAEGEESDEDETEDGEESDEDDASDDDEADDDDSDEDESEDDDASDDDGDGGDGDDD